MSASGILNSGAVVFYHPLDNSTEHTLSQDWSGSTGFAEAQIGSGIFAITGTALSGQVPTSFSSGLLPKGRASVVKLTDNKMCIVYPATADIPGAMIADISGTTVTFGPEYLFASGAWQNMRSLVVARLTPSSVMMLHNEGTVPIIDAVFHYLTISGTTVTLSDTFIQSSVNKITHSMCALTPTRCVGIFGGTPSGEMFVIDITSSGTLTIGPITNVSGLKKGDSCVRLDDNTFVFNYEDDINHGYAQIGTISGTTINIGNSAEFTTNYGIGSIPGDGSYGDITALDNKKFMILYKEANTGKVIVGSISGTTITFGSAVQFITYYAWGNIDTLSPDKAIVTYKNQDSFPLQSRAFIASVNGTIITQESESILSEENGSISNVPGQISILATIDPASFFLFYTEFDLSERRGRVVHVETSDASLTGSGYPSMSGHTRVSTCMWARNLTTPVSTVTIERGYSIVMNSGSIVLGGSATWDDGDITSLMDSMNDGEAHFLVLDFENTGSDWALETSLDGANWVSQGNQNTGSLSPVGTDTSGQISIADPKPGQWIDETVLWGGDKATLDKFTNDEVFNLYSLALSGSTMNEYIESPPPAAIEIATSGDLYISGPLEVNDNFDMYILNIGEFSASGDLYLAGPLQKTGSVDLVIVGTGVVSESVTTLGRPLDWLLKTSDHNPQIIGTFTSSVSGVNIEVWDVTNGANTAMAIPNSGCYQIGDTGRWGWSTVNLPSTQGYSKHYFYLMTSNLDTTFDGQFILDLPEGAKWIHPNEFGKYLL